MNNSFDFTQIFIPTNHTEISHFNYEFSLSTQAKTLKNLKNLINQHLFITE